MGSFVLKIKVISQCSNKIYATAVALGEKDGNRYSQRGENG